MRNCIILAGFLVLKNMVGYLNATDSYYKIYGDTLLEDG